MVVFCRISFENQRKVSSVLSVFASGAENWLATSMELQGRKISKTTHETSRKKSKYDVDKNKNLIYFIFLLDFIYI
jgi:hypothetical protein